MTNIFNFKFSIFALIAVLSIFFSIPTFTNSDYAKKINLGLDLQGGLYMLLGIKSDIAVTSKIKSIASGINYYALDENILLDNMLVNENKISFVLLDEDEKAKLETYLATIKGIIKLSPINDLFYEFGVSDDFIKQVKKDALDSTVETIRNRLDQFGLAEPSVSKQGDKYIVVELPGIKTTEEENRARALISKRAHLELMAVNEDLSDQIATISKNKLLASSSVILYDYKDITQRYIVKQIPILTGEQVTGAFVAFDENNQAVINFSLDGLGGRIFGDFTSKNVGKRLAVVLDGKVFSAPNINERIGGGSGQISGSFSVEEAGDLAIALKSGALGGDVVMLEKRLVGPSLGADSIKSSFIALISGLLLVLIFMVAYYKQAGVISIIALIVNITIIIWIMAYFGATLTLPGMAGIVLTIGMAVDANIIINERIREIAKTTNDMSKAISEGYDKAFTAILDANLTTVLVSIVLYVYGTGPIKGFALTISIGILASMFSAIIGTRGIYDALGKRVDNKKWFGL
jgi:preprotein translocase subunit SecD